MIPSSNNKYQGQGSRSKAIREYPQEKKLWVQYIWIMRNQLRSSGAMEGLKLPFQEATVVMWYHFKTKTRRDPDNYSGKLILDALKDNGFIVDDSFKEIDIFPLADFGESSQDMVEIFILPGKQIQDFVKGILKGER